MTLHRGRMPKATHPWAGEGTGVTVLCKRRPVGVSVSVAVLVAVSVAVAVAVAMGATPLVVVAVPLGVQLADGVALWDGGTTVGRCSGRLGVGVPVAVGVVVRLGTGTVPGMPSS